MKSKFEVLPFIVWPRSNQIAPDVEVRLIVDQSVANFHPAVALDTSPFPVFASEHPESSVPFANFALAVEAGIGEVHLAIEFEASRSRRVPVNPGSPS